MIYAGDKAGNPWHGTWTEDGLELPNTTVMELNNPPEGNAAAWPGWGLDDDDPRDEGEMWPSHGDCFLIRFPDQPAVTTSEEEAAAGKTWLNYALFSGFNHALYDVKIGRDRFVYIDPAGNPWSVRIQSGDYSAGFLTHALFVFTRGFVFDWQGTGSESHSTEIWIDNWGQGTFGFFVVDASETGGSVSFSLASITYQFIPVVSHTTARTAAISGTPGVDLAVEWSDRLSESEDTRAAVYDPPGETHPDITAGTFSFLEEVIRIFDGDNPIAIKLGWELDFTEKTWNAALEHYDPVTASGNLLVVTDFGTIEVPATSTITWTSESDFTCDVEVAGYEFSFSYGDPFDYGQELELMIPKLVAWRRTNKVVEITLSTINPMPLDETEAHSICLVLPDRFETTGYVITQNNSDRFFSYHPVTHELLESSAPVCFM